MCGDYEIDKQKECSPVLYATIQENQLTALKQALASEHLKSIAKFVLIGYSEISPEITSLIDAYAARQQKAMEGLAYEMEMVDMAAKFANESFMEFQCDFSELEGGKLFYERCADVMAYHYDDMLPEEGHKQISTKIPFFPITHRKISCGRIDVNVRTRR